MDLTSQIYRENSTRLAWFYPRDPVKISQARDQFTSPGSHRRLKMSTSQGSAVFAPTKELTKASYVKSVEEYKKKYAESIENPEAFWKKELSRFTWKPEPSGPFCSYNFDISKGPIFVKWFEGSSTNLSYNCLDRNIVNGHGGNVAFYWEGNEVGDKNSITYNDLHREVCKFANVLKSKGLKKGDMVAIYMPMILELPISMLACARLGIVHSVVFGGYSAEALSERILDAKCTVLISADGVYRGAKKIGLSDIAFNALEICKKKGHIVNKCIFVPHLAEFLPNLRRRLRSKDDSLPVIANLNIDNNSMENFKMWNKDRDSLWTTEMEKASEICDPVWLNAEDPLFILYTSGSTGKPKGIVHTLAGYMVYAATTFKYVFDYKVGEVYFCTADIGWITGHSYVTYGPLLNGASSLIFEGIPTYPDPGRNWQIIEDYKVTQFYTAPTAIRTLMKHGNDFVKRHNLTSLQVLGSVGEPINPEAWLWYYKVVGDSKCSIVDTYWQTETGGHVLTPLPGAVPMKPGSASFPFFGVVPALLDDNQKEIEGPGEGILVFKKPWPGMMRTIFNNHNRYESVYFNEVSGYYFTGDGAKRDEDGYYWIQGRVDDMLNVSGHLLSTAEVESAMIEHQGVAESAVVSRQHSIKGECLYCFVTLKEGYEPSQKIKDEIKLKIREKIGPVAQPDYIQFTTGLPKTRSGKIMRRILRKIARNEPDIGDVSTLAEPQIIEELLRGALN